MSKPFLIVGIGRSGTLFLQQIMNKSKLWNVKHEAKTDLKHVWIPPEPSRIKQVERRFYREEYYGEVNWLLLYHIDRMKLERRGLIFRDPVEVWISLCNMWGSARRANRFIYHFYAFYRQLEFLANSGRYRIISFKRMTTDTKYLAGVLNDFGIKDVRIKREMIKTKIHPTTIRRYNSLADLSSATRAEVLRWKKIIERWLD